MPIEPPDPPLTDGVVTLRAMGPGDLPAVEQAAADPEIIRWFGELESPGDVLAGWLDGWRDGTAAALAVCSPPDRCVGHVLVELRNSGRAHMEYWLLPAARGRGLATRALILASRWAFDALGRARLELWTEPENVTSQRLAERAGYRRDGVLRGYSEVNGRRVDAVFFGRLAGDPDVRPPSPDGTLGAG
jgi:RimJ/RimL family protein N-acetyltransferase